MRTKTMGCWMVMAVVAATTGCAAWGGILNGGGAPDPAWSNNAMQIWFKADDGALTNGTGNVTNWLDRSSYARNATISVGDGPLVVANQANGKPVLRFSSDRLATATAAMGTDAAHMFLVTKVFSKINYGHILCYGAAGAGAWRLYYLITTGYGTLANASGSAGALSAYDLSAPTGYEILEGSIVANNAWQLWLAGNTVAGPTTVAFTQGASWPFTIGARADYNDYYLDGDIAEIIVYNAALTSSDRSSINHYLATKYGMVYPQPMLWYKADAITGASDDSSLSAWTNSGCLANAFSLTQATANRQPRYHSGTSGVFNAKPYVTFDQAGGTDRYMATPGYLGVTGDVTMTIFTVADEGGVGGALYSLGNTSPGKSMICPALYGGNYYSIQYAAANQVVFTPPPAGPQILELAKTPGQVNLTTKLYINAVEQAVQAGSSTNVLSMVDNKMFMGTCSIAVLPAWGNGYSDGNTRGRIAEFLLFNGTLTATERKYWGYYLAQKYGIASKYGPPAGTIICIR